jgi:hypothetical protein
VALQQLMLVEPPHKTIQMVILFQLFIVVQAQQLQQKEQVDIPQKVEILVQ